MTWSLLAAGLLLGLIGVIHSVLGERLIFRRMRAAGWIPTDGGTLLRESHVRILWATWHLASVLGWGIAGLLCAWGFAPSPVAGAAPQLLAGAIAGGAGLVLIGTRGRHPGWLGLLLVAVLAWLGAA